MKKIISITLLVIWLVLIFCLSNDNGVESSNKSDNIASFIVSKVNSITGHDTLDNDFIIEVDNIIVIVRKIAHFLEYFILGILVLNVLNCYKIISIRLVIIAILFCFTYAISDEIHQLFVQDRTGKFTDALIDTTGSIIGTSIFYILAKRKKEQTNS